MYLILKEENRTLHCLPVAQCLPQITRNNVRYYSEKVIKYPVNTTTYMFEKKDFEGLQSLEEINALGWKDFEWFCKFFLEALGHKNVQVTPKHGHLNGDGGVDLKINKKEAYVQCKRWDPHFIGSFQGFLPVRVIRELGGCMLRDGVNKGFVIATLKCEKQDRQEAKKMNIELFCENEIAEMMRSINPKFRIV